MYFSAWLLRQIVGVALGLDAGVVEGPDDGEAVEQANRATVVPVVGVTVHVTRQASIFHTENYVDSFKLKLKEVEIKEQMEQTKVFLNALGYM